MYSFSDNAILSHPNKLLQEHVSNMLSFASSDLERDVIRFHDLAKVKEEFQEYIRGTSKNIKNKDHSLLSAYFFSM